jgi:hypothetical protein
MLHVARAQPEPRPPRPKTPRARRAARGQDCIHTLISVFLSSSKLVPMCYVDMVHHSAYELHNCTEL